MSVAGERGAGNLGVRGMSDVEAMEKDGADRTAIWRRTGWWRGVDGKWRFELPSVRMRDERELYAALIEGGNETTLGRLLDAPELFKAYPQLEDTKIVLSPEQVQPGEPGGWYDRLKNEIVLFDAGTVSLKDMPKKERGLRDHYERILNSDEYLNRAFEKMAALGIEHGT